MEEEDHIHSLNSHHLLLHLQLLHKAARLLPLTTFLSYLVLHSLCTSSTLLAVLQWQPLFVVLGSSLSPIFPHFFSYFAAHIVLLSWCLFIGKNGGCQTYNFLVVACSLSIDGVVH